MAKPLQSPRVIEFPKTIELEQRLARTELAIAELRTTVATQDATIEDLRETVELLRKRIVSLQAQLDHSFGRISPF